MEKNKFREKSLRLLKGTKERVGGRLEDWEMLERVWGNLEASQPFYCQVRRV